MSTTPPAGPAPEALAAMRAEYEDQGLEPDDLGPDPLAAVARWLEDARAAGLHEPNAMVVSTVADAQPSSRMVLLKGLDTGFVFFTNQESRKGRELAGDAACSLLFPWHALQRQVRVDGTATPVDLAESDAYFASRPRGSQIGAWASPQSQVVASREELAERYATALDRFGGPDSDDVVPRPPHWGGYRVRPHTIEFWQGRTGRMHDRVRYERVDSGTWSVDRLAP